VRRSHSFCTVRVTTKVRKGRKQRKVRRSFQPQFRVYTIKIVDEQQQRCNGIVKRINNNISWTKQNNKWIFCEHIGRKDRMFLNLNKKIVQKSTKDYLKTTHYSAGKTVCTKTVISVWTIPTRIFFCHLQIRDIIPVSRRSHSNALTFSLCPALTCHKNVPYSYQQYIKTRGRETE